MTRIAHAIPAVLMLLLSDISLAQNQLAPPKYGLREGSSIFRNETVVGGGSIPINRKYSELTAQEKAIVHGYYESMGPGDEPPFPAEGLKPLFEAMYELQKGMLVRGPLSLIASVDATGIVQKVQAVGSPSPEMTKAASSVLLLTKFKPALCAGKPCAMDYPFGFNFVVQ